MRAAYKYRLYSNQAQARFLENQLHEACELYNAALEERRDAWKVCRKSIHYYDPAKQLKPMREEGLLGLANFSCCQDVLRRLDDLPGVLRSRKTRREARLPALPFVPAVRQYHLSVLRRWLPMARRREVAYPGHWSRQGQTAPACGGGDQDRYDQARREPMVRVFFRRARPCGVAGVV